MTRDRLSAELRDVFDQQMSLCDALERIADSLPHRLDRPHCQQVANLICPLIGRAHAAEEALMFPQLAALRGDGCQVVERLRLEHIEDECFAEEVQFELQQIATGQPVLAPEATGYMLRGFFEGLRRHVRHELELMAALHMGNRLN
jgi:hemerythrin-like domain-containing protein